MVKVRGSPWFMLLLQCGTLYLFIYATLHLFIHSPLNSKPTFPTLVHSLIHIDFMVNDWQRFEPLPIFHVPICLGSALIATCSTGRRHRRGLDREPDVW